MVDVSGKLLIRPGDRVLLAGAPPAIVAAIGALPDGARFVDDGAADVALVAVGDTAAFEAAVPVLRNHAAGARVAWVAYPKRSSRPAGTLSRDTIRATLEDTTEITPVTQIALDETWSALRVRPKALVGR